MKYLSFLVCFVVPSFGHPSFNKINATVEVLNINNLNEQLWEKFQEKFNKSYNSIKEQDKRLHIFYDNLKTINHHNTAEKQSPFRWGVNQFADMTFEELLQHNFINHEEFFEAANLDDFDPPAEMLFNDDDFPKIPPETNFDWREHGIGIMSVKNQQLCGACYAFTALEVLESKILLKTGKSLEFSRQEIIDCATTHGTSGCGGGLMQGVYSYINKNGISLENDYKFTGNTASCKTNVNRLKLHIKNVIEFDTDNEDLLKKVLFNEGPLIIVIDSLHESFYRYSDGIYYEEKCNEDDRPSSHSVLLIGYGSENGTDFWIIKNSFGESWGEAGYMRIARNRNNHCKIASFNMIPVFDETSILHDLN